MVELETAITTVFLYLGPNPIEGEKIKKSLMTICFPRLQGSKICHLKKSQTQNLITIILLYLELNSINRKKLIEKYLVTICFTPLSHESKIQREPLLEKKKKKKEENEYLITHLNPDKFNFTISESLDNESECTIEVRDRTGIKETKTYPLNRHPSRIVGDYWYFISEKQGKKYKVFVYWFM
jgi:hypothetical protein